MGKRIARAGPFLAAMLSLAAPAAWAGEATAIASFTLDGGDRPYAAVTFDSVVGRPSVLYTSVSGAAGDCYKEYGCGGVVKLTPPSEPGGRWALQTIHKFHETDGDVPYSGVIFDTFGALYGTTSHGGIGVCVDSAACGTVFKLTPPPASTPDAPWTETILYKFSGVDGANPTGNLTFDSFGNLIGTTSAGGPRDCGTVYELSPPSGKTTSWTETTLYNFSCSDGERPRANLIFDTNGALYGTTEVGGSTSLGTVFKLTPPVTSGGTWALTVLHAFTGGADGEEPFNSLLLDQTGAIIGNTWKGGSAGGGVVFRLTPPTSPGGPWGVSDYEFDNLLGGGLMQGGLSRDTFGNYYGTTNRGGTGDCTMTHCGTVYELTPPTAPDGLWTHQVLADLTGPNGSDAEVTPTLHLGRLYGTGDYGGANNLGAIFEYGP